MRVLLLNPPGKRIYIRDYLCSKTTKSNYLFHPVDLLTLSGTLAQRHDTHVLDCMAERLGREEALRRITALAPDVVISLVGSVCWEEDRSFLSLLADQHGVLDPHRSGGVRILALGDVLHEASEALLEREPWLEAALHVFCNEDALHYLDGRRHEIEDMTVREEAGVRRIQRLAPKHRTGSYRVPRPRHELFPERGYHFSFARRRRFATVLTDYGCPYPCSFCVIGTLGFQTRPVADVLEEIDFLRARGVHEIFFMDQTFGVQRDRAAELCGAFTQRGDLSWTAFTRPDTAEDDLLRDMRRAGCHTVILGVESADDAMLEAYRKGYGVETVRAAFGRARAHGLRTVGTFVLGLPEESDGSLGRTLELALELEMDFMSLNVAVPRFGTEFRRQAIELGLCEPADLVMDQAGSEAFLPTSTLDRAGVLALKRRMIRRFYLRPGYLLRRVRAVKSWYELRAQVGEGLALLRRNV